MASATCSLKWLDELQHEILVSWSLVSLCKTLCCNLQSPLLPAVYLNFLNVDYSKATRGDFSIPNIQPKLKVPKLEGLETFLNFNCLVLTLEEMTAAITATSSFSCLKIHWKRRVRAKSKNCLKISARYCW